jgi:hypothetical protein
LPNRDVFESEWENGSGAAKGVKCDGWLWLYSAEGRCAVSFFFLRSAAGWYISRQLRNL